MTLDTNLGAAFDQSGEAGSVAYHPWKADALQKVTDEGNLVKLTNVYSPLDTPCSIKLTNTRIANVYNTIAKGMVPLANQAANISGQAIFVEVTAMMSTGTGASKIIVPVIGRLELRLPNNGDLTETDVDEVLSILLATISDDEASLRVTEMMRGSLRPSS